MIFDIGSTKVSVVDVDNVTEEEAQAYLDDIRKQFPHEHVESLTIKNADNDCVALEYDVKPPKFDRIRRITGYLVGTLDRFNNGKRAEEHDRVKHSF